MARFERHIGLRRPPYSGFLLLAAFLCLSISCGSQAQSAGGSSSGSPSTTGLSFPYQQGWLGGDAGYSVSFGPNASGENETLWLFGDTFVGPADATSRTQATTMVHNTIGISTCSAAESCTWQYYWAGMNSASPGPQFSTGTTDWYWPMDGFVYGGTLYLALSLIKSTGTGGAFGFASDGAVLACINNYLEPPSTWSVTYQNLNVSPATTPGESIVVAEGPNGNPDPADPSGAGAAYAYFFTLIATNSALTQYMALARLPLTLLSSAARPANNNWQYLNTSSAWVSWPGTQTDLPKDAMVVIPPIVAAGTVHYHSSTNQWIQVNPGVLSDTVIYSVADAMTGPWGQSENLYAYPEMESSNPNYTPNVFCYAALEHPEFETTGQLFFTYACNSFDESDVINNMNLYRPQAVTVSLPQQ